MQNDIRVERQCTVNHRWFNVAWFELGVDAMDCAKALSKADGCTYRVIDERWPEESKPLVSLYAAGEWVA